MADHTLHVAEMPGLYGPFTLTERVVQKIWLRGDYDRTRLVLVDGRLLEVESAGRWNLLAGPDFQAARLRIGGQAITGDIEVHFHARDWRAHGHAADPAYDHVALHVVLFPPAAGETPAQRGDGSVIPTLVLLPYLHRGLEEYGSDDALETLTERDEWQHYAELAAQPADELRRMLRERARVRWRQKIHFAGLRLARLGWEAALHHTAMEILGYRHNRAAMLTVAGRCPLAAWRRSGCAWEAVAAGLTWQRSGVRPANLPETRLRQYQRWVERCPDWPQRWRDIAPTLPAGDLAEAETKRVRQAWKLARWRERLAVEVMGEAVGGTRLDNLICDGFLPLWAAEQGGEEAFGVWFHWSLGDVPLEVRRVLRKLAVVDRTWHPHCHGWGQGLLAWFLARPVGASA